MSNIKTFNKKSRKGISPVIATVILVAVAVVIAAALAGFSSSLFGSYSSQGAAVNVKTLEVSEANGGEFTLDMVNNGNTADSIVSVSIPPNPATAIAVGNGDLAPHSTGITGGALTAQAIDLGGAVAGNTVTVKINMQSGLQLTQSVIVGP